MTAPSAESWSPATGNPAVRDQDRGERDRFAAYVVGLGDDALITAQRLSEWYAAAPDLEEDIALANIALDQLGTARLLLSYAAQVQGAGRDEDALAFLRDSHEFRNCLLVELPNGDFAHTMGRLLLISAYQWLLYEAAADGGDEPLAAIAAKARKESVYHLDHAAQWAVRLGDGTEESHRRMQSAIDELWPYTHELFLPVAPFEMVGTVDPAALRGAWLSAVEPVLAEATLIRPADGWAPEGGRRGVHTEHLSRLLAEMQSVHRAHPGASW